MATTFSRKMVTKVLFRDGEIGKVVCVHPHTYEIVTAIGRFFIWSYETETEEIRNTEARTGVTHVPGRMLHMRHLKLSDIQVINKALDGTVCVKVPTYEMVTPFNRRTRWTEFRCGIHFACSEKSAVNAWNAMVAPATRAHG